MNQFAKYAANAANAANAGSNPMSNFTGQVASPNPFASVASPMDMMKANHMDMMKANPLGQLADIKNLNTGSVMNLAKTGASTSPLGVASAAALEAGKYAWKIIKKMFRLDTFKLLVMLLLFMAYLIFVLATLMFVNACINFHKTQTSPTPTSTSNTKLKDLPIFDYLKTNNFMFLDTFIMNKDSKLFIAITSIIGGAIGLLLFHTAVLLNAEQKDKDNFKKYTTELLKQKITYIIAAIIYFVFYVVFISAYYTQIATNSCVPDATFNTYRTNNKDIVSYNKRTLQAIKKDIQHKLYGNGDGGSIGLFKASDYEMYKVFTVNDTAKATIDIDIASIFLIYRNNLQNRIKKAEEDRVNVEQVKRQYTREYINYIDEYFELLGRKDADNYQKFYFVGLIEYDDANETNDANIYILYRGFKNNLNTMKSKIATYFILIITFYILMCMAIFALLFLANTSIQKPVIETLYRIARILRLV